MTKLSIYAKKALVRGAEREYIRGGRGFILNHNRPTEFEVHSEAYQRLKEHFNLSNIEVRGEYILKEKGKRGARFDIVLLQDQKIILVIEVKKSICKKRLPKKLSYYSQLAKAPCIYISGMKEAEMAVSIIDNLWSDGDHPERFPLVCPEVEG